MTDDDMKPLSFIGTARKDLKKFPQTVRDDVGFECDNAKEICGRQATERKGVIANGAGSAATRERNHAEGKPCVRRLDRYIDGGMNTQNQRER